ncbi:Alkaline shock protein 23 [Streptomyces sp. S4.7]|uniref:Asp23/Gls24 family envelope stress response protein n=1 Tax=unclassified Streptomyces TaxID=2593676 RepID=UPI0011CA7925|nr:MULTISPECIES: Asp23/Gls24 family envelope stress response protein [unclassified Streptomyces]QHY99733.1 Alkaline shock protein 23 [Streptomyces sp. S4.7]TXL90034.1 Asp23/Gls24 family envelope stress response protein [Streptomyces sp. IB2014 016-6]
MASTDTSSRPATHASSTSAKGGGPGGTTTIADSVVATIAGIAVRESDGIYALGGSASRALGSVRDRMSKAPDPSRGVKVEVGETQTAVDVDVIVEYGEPIAEDAKDIRTRVTDAVETMTGLEVVEININVLDVHLPGSDDEDEDGGRRSDRVQ